ncbi:MAG TPA: glycosyl hydrolase family 8 [Verrucomicrobiae bacterium]|nr:glycosyl hydrolase family 8 [Verrucomicrobiae bacterium]
MKLHWPGILAVVAVWITGCSELQPSHGTQGNAGEFASGQYRNLFTENGHSPEEAHRKIEDAFQQLFHGNPTNEAVYYSTGSNSNGPLACIEDIAHEDVRTEGLSYGMMIAVQLDKKTEFNALWNWSKTFLYHSETNHPSFGFFSWEARTNGMRMSEFVAPDGEEYYVTALYFAANRWGNGTGIYNYKQEADELLGRMKNRAMITGQLEWRHATRTVTAGPLFDAEHKMVLFSPSSERNRLTDPSYHLPAFYELWSRWGPVQDRAFWREAAAASREFFPHAVDPVTGLNPDYANFDGSPAPSSGSRTNFGYDSFRTAGNWSVDWAWWAKEPRERELSDRLQSFFESQGTNYGCRFTLDGECLEASHAPGLVAVNAVASLAAADPIRSKKFVEELWNTKTPAGIGRYYDGLLYLMSLMHCAGEFRIWQPVEKSAVKEHWAGTWGCGVQLVEPANRPPVPLATNTLREFVRVSIGGKRLRARFSNIFGTEPVTMNSVHIALSTGTGSASGGEINAATDTALTFNGAASMVIPPGTEVWSDPFKFNLPPLTNVAVSIYFGNASATTISGHPGSRTTSYIVAGNAVSSPNMPKAAMTAHWYILTGIDVLAHDANKTIVVLGDSITDGRGSTTDGNNRWPDSLAQRLTTNALTAGLGTINMGIGGNGIFGGLGPSAQARFERDVLNQSGVHWLILFEGVNDIGGNTDASRLTNALAQFIDKAHEKNIRAYGATITPFGGSGYSSPAHEKVRQVVNDWIRTSGRFDAVIDFDAAVRDTATPTNLTPAYDTGDHLHLNPAGYQVMARAIDLKLFAP